MEPGQGSSCISGLSRVSWTEGATHHQRINGKQSPLSLAPRGAVSRCYGNGHWETVLLKVDCKMMLELKVISRTVEKGLSQHEITDLGADPPGAARVEVEWRSAAQPTDIVVLQDILDLPSRHRISVPRGQRRAVSPRRRNDHG